jgi:glycosyltransferase involved in cell wall biosynthesis
MNLPRITVVTHTLGAAQHLEQTIRSVLDQRYDNLEYFICDSGNGDLSNDLLQKYEGRFTRISAPESNTPQGINKAFAGASGEVHCLINGGDQLEQGSLLAAAQAYAAGNRWITGWSQIAEAGGNQWPHLPRPHGSKLDWLTYNPLRWQAGFWSAKFTFDLRGFSQDLLLAFEYDFWVRLAFHAGAMPHMLRRCMGTFRVPENYIQPAHDDPYELEAVQIQQKYRHHLPPPEQRLLRRRQSQKQSPVLLSPM